ncbi:MAG: 30S ribosomal protein S6 [Dehalococcoidia bacterium]|nr:30S ribosomal protein S6 [Dehalococcoidia bacterium]
MREYELVTIISPEVDEEEVSGIMDKVVQSISSRGGIVDETNKWGKRKLAYPIRKFMEANYVLTCFKLEPELIKEVEAEIRALGDILRHLVVLSKG